MDPDACFKWLLEYLEANRYDEAQESLNDLKEWLSKGGFAPDYLEVLSEFLLRRVV